MQGEISIVATTQTPAQLFSGSACFITPEFQRPYVWNQEQIDQLWNDLTAITGHPAQKHFAGVILLQDDLPNNHIRTPKIIDGQQRLTTIQLLIAALRTAHQQRNNHDEAQILYDIYLTNQAGVPADQPELAYKIRHSQNREATEFRRCISQGYLPPRPPANQPQQQMIPQPGHATEDGDSSIITAAYRRLLQNVNEHANRNPLKPLQDTLLNRISIAVIKAQAEEPVVYTMFSRLNAAGTPLSIPDLLKAETFQQIAALPNPAEQAATQDLWTYSDDPYWRENLGSGLNSQPHLGHLLLHWLSAESGEFIPNRPNKNGAIAAYRKTIQKRGIRDSLTNLKSYAEAYRRIHTQTLKQYPEFVRDFHAAGHNTAYPLTLFCLTQLHQDAQKQALEYLGSYLVRLALTRTTKGMNKTICQITGNAAKQLRRTGGEIPPGRQADIIRDQLLNITANLSWPDNREVVDHLSNNPLSPNRAHHIIKAIAEHLESPAADTAVRNNSTLEHIMPQAWRKRWPLSAGADPEERTKAVLMLGNLTLLHSGNNAQAGNGGWPEKRYALSRSNLTINRELAGLENWDESAIRERSKRLAEIACEIWPKPERGMII